MIFAKNLLNIYFSQLGKIDKIRLVKKCHAVDQNNYLDSTCRNFRQVAKDQKSNYQEIFGSLNSACQNSRYTSKNLQNTIFFFLRNLSFLLTSSFLRKQESRKTTKIKNRNVLQ